MMSKISRWAKHYAVLISLLVLWLIWGYNFLVIKIALRDVGPFLFAALRTLFSFVVLVIGLALTGHLQMPRKHLGLLFLLGLLQTGGFTGFTYLALVSGGTGKTALLAFTNPLWATLCAWYFLSDRPKIEHFCALVMSIVGILLVVQFWAGHASIISNVYALLAGISLGASSVVIKKLQAHGEGDLFHVTVWQMLFGSVPLILGAIIIPERPLVISSNFLFGLGYNVFSTAVGWPLWFFILKKMPAGVANINTLTIPMIGIFSGWMHLNERLTIVDVIGMICISTSILWLWFGSKKLGGRLVESK